MVVCAEFVFVVTVVSSCEGDFVSLLVMVFLLLLLLLLAGVMVSLLLFVVMTVTLFCYYSS